MSELHLPNRIRHSASTRPSDPAITCGDRTLTWAELDGETSTLASALAEVTTTGARVGALLRMGLEGAETFIACAKAGAVFIPLNWRLNPLELVDIAEDAELDVLIVDDEFAAGAAAMSAALPDIEVITVGAAGGLPDSRTWAEFVASGTGVDPGHGHDPDAAVLQLYTSGTTGRPKGVVATHRNLYNEPEGFDVYEFGSNAVALDALPLFHIAGAGWMSTCLSAGVPLVLLGDMAPARVADAIATTPRHPRISGACSHSDAGRSADSRQFRSDQPGGGRLWGVTDHSGAPRPLDDCLELQIRSAIRDDRDDGFGIRPSWLTTIM